MFMPEMGDEVLVAFEHGDPERPYIVGALWNGVSSAPRQGFSGSTGVEAVAAAGDGSSHPVQIPPEIAGNNVKRIVTKSGHRIQFVDDGKSKSIVVATSGDLRIQMIDEYHETGRPMICLSTLTGDIFLNAPMGRVHIRSLFFSKEVGPGPDVPA